MSFSVVAILSQLHILLLLSWMRLRRAACASVEGRTRGQAPWLGHRARLGRTETGGPRSFRPGLVHTVARPARKRGRCDATRRARPPSPLPRRPRFNLRRRTGARGPSDCYGALCVRPIHMARIRASRNPGSRNPGTSLDSLETRL